MVKECIGKYNETEHSITDFTSKCLLDNRDVSMASNDVKSKITIEDWTKDKKLALENTIKSYDHNKRLFDKKP